MKDVKWARRSAVHLVLSAFHSERLPRAVILGQRCVVPGGRNRPSSTSRRRKSISYLNSSLRRCAVRTAPRVSAEARRAVQKHGPTMIIRRLSRTCSLDHDVVRTIAHNHEVLGGALQRLARGRWSGRQARGMHPSLQLTRQQDVFANIMLA